MENQIDLKDTIEDSFTQYAGAVIQSRALVDVRDCVKPSARQIYYCMHTDNFVHSKPFNKTLKAIGSAMRMYIHGDSSCEGIIMRSGQPFSMRYPLVEVEGSHGTLTSSGNWAAPRYCLTGDAFISTDKGLLRMKDVVESEENSDNEIQTLTCRGAFGLTTANVFFNSGVHQTYKLTLKNGIQISGTPNHPILTLDNEFNFAWKTIDELNVGDKILLNVNDNFLYGQENDLEYAKLIGRIIGGCSTVSADTIADKELYLRLKNDNCINDHRNKHIPNSVFVGTKEYQQEFLRYMFENGGNVYVADKEYSLIRYMSYSVDLIHELQIILLSNFGIMSSINIEGDSSQLYLEIRGKDIPLFAENIGFISEKKNKKLKQVISFWHDKQQDKGAESCVLDAKLETVYDNFISIPIIKKEDNGFQVVYSPKINEECHSYTANGIINHNTSSRLSNISDYLLQDTNKNTIDEWIDNYDDTEQYPRVLSSLGFYNIVNGSMGIAVGIASSIPQFNLTEVNNALITLLKNPQCDFNDILCFPDFCTGATILNKDEVAESLKVGNGKGCLIRATIDYDKKANALVVKDLPYGVYTNTICDEITKLVDKDNNCGIVNINDLTGEEVNIKIYLDKHVDPDIIKSLLYEKTSLESTYGINMTMLEDGRFPKVFGWREALQAHLDHEKATYIKLYRYNLSKLEHRLKIVMGIIAAIDNINDVINLIKKSKDNAVLVESLKSMLDIDDEQAKAILDIKLSRLAKLEAQKMFDERDSLNTRIKEINDILNSNELLEQQMINKFKEVSDKFGDERRTKIVQEDVKKEKNRIAKKKSEPESVVAVVNKDGYIKSIPVKSYRQSSNDIMAVKTFDTQDIVRIYTNLGKVYRIPLKNVKKCSWNDKGTALGSILSFEQNEVILAADCVVEAPRYKYIYFATKNGMVKKASVSEFDATTRSYSGVKCIGLKGDDEIIGVIYGNDSMFITLGTANGYSIRFNSSYMSATGKTSAGVKGITLTAGDRVTSFAASKSDNGKVKLQKRGGKGAKVK